VKIKVVRRLWFLLDLGVVIHAESNYGTRSAIGVILGELRSVKVVKTTSAVSSICPVDKSAYRTLSIRFQPERAFK